MEKWKIIEGFDDYEVSDLGRVREKRFVYYLKEKS